MTPPPPIPPPFPYPPLFRPPLKAAPFLTSRQSPSPTNVPNASGSCSSDTRRPRQPDPGRRSPLHGDPRPDRSHGIPADVDTRSEEHTSELQSRLHLVCRLLL